MWPATTRATLFEKNDSIRAGIKKATVVGDQTRAWSTVQKDHGLSVGRAALFVIKFVESGHSDVPAVVWFDLGIKSSSCFHVAGDYRFTTRRTANAETFFVQIVEGTRTNIVSAPEEQDVYSLRPWHIALRRIAMLREPVAISILLLRSRTVYCSAWLRSTNFEKRLKPPSAVRS